MSQPDWLPHEGHPNLTGRPDFFLFQGDDNICVGDETDLVALNASHEADLGVVVMPVYRQVPSPP
jgi:hypothetical protein